MVTERRKRGQFARFVVINQDGFIRKVSTGDIKISPVDMRVAMLLLSEVEVGNHVYQTQKVLAAKLKAEQATVSRSIAKLIANDFCCRDENAKGVKSLMINPRVAWKGLWSRHVTAQSTYNRLATVSTQQALDKGKANAAANQNDSMDGQVVNISDGIEALATGWRP